MTETFDTSPLVAAVRRRFREEFGAGDARVFFAPGRVNLIGNHVDYNGGTVLPVAVNKGVFLAARLGGDGVAKLRSLDCAPPVDVELSTLGDAREAGHGWASYPLGVAKYFAEATGQMSGVEMVFGGDLPIASGLSSSAALEVATAFALDAMHGAGLALEDLARVGFLAETQYIGLQCGIMDQFASALGRLDHALVLDCGSVAVDYVQFDSQAIDLLVLDTRVPRALAGSSYNQRVAECADAHSILTAVRERRWLAEYTADDLAAAQGLTGDPRSRATHVVEEMVRVRAAVTALRAHDLVALGRLLDASHASSRDLYAVSCPELDVITEAARECDGVFGARLTGAGFGGCAVALVRPGSADEVRAHVEERFEAAFGCSPDFHLLRAGPGPAELGSG